MINNIIIPGFLEVFCGPMKSGKTRELLNRVDKLQYIDNLSFIFFKPKADTRDKNVKSRFGNLSYECTFIDEKNPKEIFDYILPVHQLIIIDEIHLFNSQIIEIIKELLNRGLNVVVGGLDLDFRGEIFGSMRELLGLANNVVKLNSICDYPGCNNLAVRTQRLKNGKPADYNEPLVSIEGALENETYECRCLKHHFVPGKIKTL